MLFYSSLAQKIRAGGLSLTPSKKILSELGGLENELGGSTPQPPPPTTQSLVRLHNKRTSVGANPVVFGCADAVSGAPPMSVAARGLPGRAPHGTARQRCHLQALSRLLRQHCPQRRPHMSHSPHRPTHRQSPLSMVSFTYIERNNNRGLLLLQPSFCCLCFSSHFANGSVTCICIYFVIIMNTNTPCMFCLIMIYKYIGILTVSWSLLFASSVFCLFINIT